MTDAVEDVARDAAAQAAADVIDTGKARYLELYAERLWLVAAIGVGLAVLFSTVLAPRSFALGADPRLPAAVGPGDRPGRRAHGAALWVVFSGAGPTASPGCGSAWPAWAAFVGLRPGGTPRTRTGSGQRGIISGDSTGDRRRRAPSEGTSWGRTGPMSRARNPTDRRRTASRPGPTDASRIHVTLDNLADLANFDGTVLSGYGATNGRLGSPGPVDRHRAGVPAIPTGPTMPAFPATPPMPPVPPRPCRPRAAAPPAPPSPGLAVPVARPTTGPAPRWGPPRARRAGAREREEEPGAEPALPGPGPRSPGSTPAPPPATPATATPAPTRRSTPAPATRTPPATPTSGARPTTTCRCRHFLS